MTSCRCSSTALTAGLKTTSRMRNEAAHACCLPMHIMPAAAAIVPASDMTPSKAAFWPRPGWMSSQQAAASEAAASRPAGSAESAEAGCWAVPANKQYPQTTHPDHTQLSMHVRRH